MSVAVETNLPDARGRFGPYGGRYVPETLMYPLQQLEEEYHRAQQDPEFQRNSIIICASSAAGPLRFILPSG